MKHPTSSACLPTPEPAPAPLHSKQPPVPLWCPGGQPAATSFAASLLFEDLSRLVQKQFVPGSCPVKQLCTSGPSCGQKGAEEKKNNQKLQNADRIYPTKSWPERILRGKFRFGAKIACKVNHWPVPCSRWEPGYFYERNFQKKSMCNLVGAQVVHLSGMINSGFFLNMFFIHHGRLLPVMGHNGCPMNRLLCNFVENHDD